MDQKKAETNRPEGWRAYVIFFAIFCASIQKIQNKIAGVTKTSAVPVVKWSTAEKAAAHRTFYTQYLN